MRILLVHNYYRTTAPSGENAVVAAERDLLRANGHEVEEFSRSNDEETAAPLRTRAEAALFMTWNPRSAAAIQAAIAHFRPDVIHVHNTFPLLSPSVVAEGARSGVPVVCTLHNYRLFCAVPALVRDGQPCTLCLEKRSALPGLIHACYEGSRLKTLPLAATIAWHRRRQTWSRNAKLLLAVSEFQRGKLILGGLPPDSIRVRAQYSAKALRIVPWQQRADKALFVGRLSFEKGCETLIRAWAAWGADAPPLDIVGDGPLRRDLEDLTTRLGAGGRIRFRGQLPKSEVQDELARSKLLVHPSRALESFGLTVIEAFAQGVPVVASKIGALPELIDEGRTGFLFEAGNPGDLVRALQFAWSDQSRLERISAAVRELHAQRYAPDTGLKTLLAAYQSALSA